MSVSSPVLERKINTRSESGYRSDSFRGPVMSDEEVHNSQISSNYAKLINPECSLNDIITRDTDESNYDELYEAPAREIYTQGPYLVENARADAEIFRADSIINRRVAEAETPVAMETESDEEENEDLRPTQTTIQYKTAGVKTADEGKIEIHSTARKSGISGKDKVIIAAIVCAVIALFVLIIVNSAIISNINNDLSSLQSSLTSAKAAYSSISDEIQEYLTNLSDTVAEFAVSNGMGLK